MIKRIYIDNYKSLVNFEMNLERVNLFMGENGSGKSAVLEVVAKVSAWAARTEIHEQVEHELPTTSRTETRWKWRTPGPQTLEIDWDRPDDARSMYRVEFEFGGVEPENDSFGSIEVERGIWGGNLGFRREKQRHACGGETKYRGYGLALQRSVLAQHESMLNPDCIAIRAALARISFFKPSPQLMSDSVTANLDTSLDPTLSNFATWVIGKQANDPDSTVAFNRVVCGVLKGFRGLKVHRTGTQQVLWASFASGLLQDGTEKTVRYRLSELSDGQRTILCLYAISQWLLTPGFVLMIDEPENFIALKELQPWLRHVIDLAEERDGQLIIVSHHPEFLNFLARDHGWYFWRENGGPTQVRKWGERVPKDTGQRPSDLIVTGLDPNSFEAEAVDG